MAMTLAEKTMAEKTMAEKTNREAQRPRPIARC